MDAKKAIPILLGIIVVGGGFLWLLIYTTGTVNEKNFEIDKLKLMEKFTSEDGWIRPTPEPSRYINEIKIALKQYFTELDNIYKKYEKQENLETWKKDWEARKADDKLGDKKLSMEADYMAAYNTTVDVYKMLKSDNYKPIYTMEDQSVRFDIYRMKGGDIQGQPAIVVEYVIWGGFGDIGCDFSMEIYDEAAMKRFEEEERAKVDPEFAEELAKRKEEEKRKREHAKKRGKDEEENGDEVLGMRAEGGCKPVLGVNTPQLYVENFPPEARFGYFGLPKLPKEAKAFDISFKMTRGGKVGSYNLEMGMKQVDIQPDWYAAGEWKGKEITAPAEGQ